ncbi:GNAT family N-acetyltransferase [Acinetobacter sp. ANC 3882]|uniref:GNAT family N-acetyltransferase n=1 Tax=Acinetobacter sp. ANC 3882 TaxID=2923423 RepID=UPI001F4AB599|nr:GNAT family N-acetyltransferase [Acinetobacter sp. ANC 3882]MCH7315275.1 GNAT family N-acetyltransferase [Acinetobacter sp. ANC 3882]
MQLRALEQQDYQNWLWLWQGYQAFYKVEIDHQVTEKTFTRLLDPDEQMQCLVVVDQDRLIAFVHFIFHRSTWTTGDYCYLQDLFVDQHSRIKGLGRKLIEAVYQKAAERECSRVYWLTHETNYQARMLYDSMAVNAGFIQYRKNFH